MPVLDELAGSGTTPVGDDGYRELLDVLLRRAGEGVTAQASDGRLVYANDAAARLCGFTDAAEMLQTPSGELTSRYFLLDEAGAPLSPSELPGRLAARGLQPPARTVRFRDRVTGIDRWSLVSSAPVFSSGGRVRMVVNSFREVTEVRLAEARWRLLAEASSALAQSLDYGETLQSVVRLPVPHFADWCTVDVLDDHGALQLVAVHHLDPEKVALMQALRLRYPPLPDRDTDGMMRVIREGKPILIADLSPELVSASACDEEHRRLLLSLELRSAISVPLLSRGRPFGVLTLVYAAGSRRYGEADLLFAQELGRRAALAIENAQLYQEARRSIELRDSFLAMASHELRTPLTALLLQAERLVRGTAKGDRVSPEQLGARAGSIQRYAQRLSGLVDQLLDASRMGVGKLELVPEEVDLVELAEEVMARFEDQLRGTATTVAVQGPVALVGVWDRLRLDQVLTNLLSNAVKYGAGQPVQVVIARAGDLARLEVRDRGIGIAAADQARIFDRFERASSARAYGGIGVGLWIVRQMVALLGGRVDVESAPGQGATFLVELPLAATG